MRGNAHPFLELGSDTSPSSITSLPVIEATQECRPQVDMRVKAELAHRLWTVLQAKLDKKKAELNHPLKLRRNDGKRRPVRSPPSRRSRVATVRKDENRRSDAVVDLRPSTAAFPGTGDRPKSYPGRYPRNAREALISFHQRVEDRLQSRQTPQGPYSHGPDEVVRVNRLIGIPNYDRRIFAGLGTPYTTRSGHYVLGVAGLDSQRIRPAAWYMDPQSAGGSGRPGSSPDDWSRRRYLLSSHDADDEWLVCVQQVLDARYGRPLTSAERQWAMCRVRERRMKNQNAEFPRVSPPTLGAVGDHVVDVLQTYAHLSPNDILRKLPPGCRYVDGVGFMNLSMAPLSITEEMLTQWGLLPSRRQEDVWALPGYDTQVPSANSGSLSEPGSQTLTDTERLQEGGWRSGKTRRPCRDLESDATPPDQTTESASELDTVTSPTTAEAASRFIRPSSRSLTRANLGSLAMTPSLLVAEGNVTSPLEVKTGQRTPSSRASQKTLKSNKKAARNADMVVGTRPYEKGDGKPSFSGAPPARATFALGRKVREVLDGLDSDLSLPLLCFDSITPLSSPHGVGHGGLMELLRPKDDELMRAPSLTIGGLDISLEHLQAKLKREAHEEFAELTALRDTLKAEVELALSLTESFKTDIHNLSTCTPGTLRDDYAVRLTREVNRFAKKNNLSLGHLATSDNFDNSSLGGEVAAGFLNHFGKGTIPMRDVACQVCEEELGYVDASTRAAQRKMEDLFYHERALRNSIKMSTVAIANIMSFHASLEIESTCKECFYLFDHPRTLWPCGHTFCQKCLSGMHNRRDQIICSECGSLCEVGFTPNLSIELVSNYQIIQATDTEESKGHVQTIEGVLRSLLNGIISSERASRAKRSLKVAIEN